MTDDHIKAKDIKKIQKRIADNREQLIDKLNITIREKDNQKKITRQICRIKL